MLQFGVLFSLLAFCHATRFMSPMEDAARYYTKDANSLLRDIIDEMGNDLDDTVNPFMDYQDGPRESNEYDNVKEIPVLLDYDALENLNPNPSIRDQEYLRHSTLWSYQHPNQEILNHNHKIQQGGLNGGIKFNKGGINEKTSLPTYCTPPNPCPIGYTEEDHCLIEFENTAAFSRNFQNSQDCMCDVEHMFSCPNGSNRDESSNEQMDPNFNIVERYQEKNPYFHGEKLPIAAKKGLNVIY